MKKKRTPDEVLYDDLNKKLFRGRLPEFRVTRAKPGVGNLTYAMGMCSVKRRLILLSADLSGERLRQTLLHEMCHARGGSEEHGAFFRTQLRALGRQGETWAGSEIDYYRYQEKSDLYMIRKRLERLIADRIKAAVYNHSATSWIDLRRLIALELKIPSRELAKIFAWIRGYYYHQIEGARAEKGMSRLFFESNCSEPRHV